MIAMTSKRRVRPYRSTTSRSESRPSLHCVWTWKSQSRNGSYPGTSGPHVQMVGVRRPVPQDLRPEVADVELEHRPLAHGAIPARRRPDPAVARDVDAAERPSAAGRGSCPRRGTRSCDRTRRSRRARRRGPRSCRRRESPRGRARGAPARASAARRARRRAGSARGRSGPSRRTGTAR